MVSLAFMAAMMPLLTCSSIVIVPEFKIKTHEVTIYSSNFHQPFLIFEILT